MPYLSLPTCWPGSCLDDISCGELGDPSVAPTTEAYSPPPPQRFALLMGFYLYPQQAHPYPFSVQLDVDFSALALAPAPPPGSPAPMLGGGGYQPVCGFLVSSHTCLPLYHYQYCNFGYFFHRSLHCWVLTIPVSSCPSIMPWHAPQI